MRYLIFVLLCFVLLRPVALGQSATGQKTQNVSDLCAIRKVAITGSGDALKQTRKRVEKLTWLKRVDSPEQADAVLDAQIMLTSFSASFSGKRVSSLSREGYVSMKLTQRQPQKLLWEGKRDLGTDSIIDNLLMSLQKEANCAKR
jgi:hypothetical protein